MERWELKKNGRGREDLNLRHLTPMPVPTRLRYAPKKLQWNDGLIGTLEYWVSQRRAISLYMSKPIIPLFHNSNIPIFVLLIYPIVF